MIYTVKCDGKTFLTTDDMIKKEKVKNKFAVERTNEVLPAQKFNNLNKKTHRFKVSLREKDLIFLTYYFGKKSGESVIMMRGTDATKVESVTINQACHYSTTCNTYLLNASKLVDDNKMKDSQRVKKGTTKKIVTATLWDEDGELAYEDAFLGVEEKDYSFNVSKKYLDTTGSNISRVPGIIIDIDAHGYGLPEKDFVELANSLDFYLKDEYNIPVHFINFTGRGLQLFFSVNEFNPNNKVMYALASDCNKYLKKIVREIITFLSTEDNYYKYLIVDDSISPKRQMFRMPGTVNFTSGKVAHCLVENHKIKRHIMSSLVENCKSALGIKSTGKEWIDYKKEAKSKHGKVTHYKGNAKMLLERRIHDDILLLEHRGEGSRNDCYCNMVISMISLKMTDNEIINKLLTIDEQFHKFRSTHDVEKFVAGVEKLYNSRAVNGVYKLTNRKIEDEWYGITAEEYNSLEFLTYGLSSQKELKLERRRKAKMEKIDAILNYYVEQVKSNCVNISKIAREFSISRTTVYTYINDYSHIINSLLTDVKEVTKDVIKEIKNLFFNNFVSANFVEKGYGFFSIVEIPEICNRAKEFFDSVVGQFNKKLEAKVA